MRAHEGADELDVDELGHLAYAVGSLLQVLIDKELVSKVDAEVLINAQTIVYRLGGFRGEENDIGLHHID